MKTSLGWVVAAALMLAAVGCDEDGASAADGGSDRDGSTGADSGSGTAPSSDYLTEQELERVTMRLASDELNGRDEGTPGGEAARAFLVEQMQQCGVEPAGQSGYEQPITTGQGVNLLGQVPGTGEQRAERVVLISAHYDHLGACDGAICNGADDNAAGVAIALGVACTFATDPAPRTVMVAFWDAEEPPTFMTDEMGSAFFVSNPTIELERIDASIVLDLVGSDLWQGYEGHFVLGEETSPQLTAALDATQVPEQLPVQRGGLHLIEQTPFGHQPWSDYNALRNAQVPVLFLSNGQNQRYHTPADEMDMVNMPKIAREGRMLLSLTGKLAHAEQSAQFAAERTIYPQDATSMRRVLEAALADGGLVDSLGLSQRSRSSLQRDLQAVTEAEERMESGSGATQDDVQALRNAAQRIMCLAGPTYDEGTCNLF